MQIDWFFKFQSIFCYDLNVWIKSIWTECDLKSNLYQEYTSEKARVSQRKDGSVRNSRTTKNDTICVTPERVNDAILRFIIEDLQPFNRTESKSFQNLLAGKFLFTTMSSQVNYKSHQRFYFQYALDMTMQMKSHSRWWAVQLWKGELRYAISLILIPIKIIFTSVIEFSFYRHFMTNMKNAWSQF